MALLGEHRTSSRFKGSTADTTILINSLAPGWSECHPKNLIFNLGLLIGIFWSSHDNVLRWMPMKDLTEDKSTLVQVMAWCRQTTRHYLSQCWPSSLSLYGVAGPQWVKQQRPSPWCHRGLCVIIYLIIMSNFSLWASLSHVGNPELCKLLNA